MNNIKKYLSFWIYLMFHLTKIVLYKIALSNNKFVKMLEYGKKDLDNYYRGEGKLFIGFQIFMVWTSLIYAFIDKDFFAFNFCIGLWSIITVLRTIEYLEPDWIS